MQHDFILLDRSGSMQSLWAEALGSINAYVKKLADDAVDTGVTLAVFDGNGFDVIRDRITPGTWKMVSSADAEPRGSTPLSDSIGKIVAMAKAGNYDKLAIIIMTDGHENASKELSVAQAKALLDECRGRNWQVIFLGADFDNASQAAGYGNAAASTIKSSAVNLDSAMRATASMRSSYGATGAAMHYTDEQKRQMAQQK